MKKQLTTILFSAFTMIAWGNHPDSVYIRPDVKDGTKDFQIAYSVDGKRWMHIDCTLFSSDYGPWGRQKKMYYPVLSYDGKKYGATFIPDLSLNEIAVTETNNLTLWKPQDYPRMSEQQFASYLEKQKVLSKKNIIRIPWADLHQLLDKKQLAGQYAVWDAENFVATGAHLANAVEDITAKLKIDCNEKKAISPNLMGIFFEDISYAADGGLYAELIQNRDFEYSSKDRGEWSAQTAWRIEGEGLSWHISTDNPLHKNNAHYAVLNTDKVGARLVNEGWDGISVKAKEKYNLSLFVKGKGAVKVKLIADGQELASTVVKAASAWKQSKAVLVPNRTAANALLAIEPMQEGELSIDFISLFPKDTYKGRENGLRRDLAEVIADLKPRFVRFPGGCATHGNGIDNIYHWQATIGDLWERQYDFNIWNYHQTRGLGFYEYFQFCEDIGAEPLPVLAAGVPCQNSSRGGNGQQGGIPFEKDLNGKPSPYIYNGKPLTMESYLQELLDLIEWANGDAKTSKLAAMRAKAGHPKPFGMKYLGIGNEDLLSDVFMERYRFLIEGVKKVHPEITIVGTVGPFWEGSDYEYGWKEAKEKNIEIVDEHYYNTPGWYFHHRDFYDKYDRNGTKVYLGEWASKGNNVSNALVEAAYLTNVERNADVVVMSSYAPLLAKEKHTNWNPDLIYFNNEEVKPTANYYVQRAFGHNGGDTYVYSDLTLEYKQKGERKVSFRTMTERIDKSVVIDSKTGDMIVKFVNMMPNSMKVSLEDVEEYDDKANAMVLAGSDTPDKTRTWTENSTSQVNINNGVTVPAYSLTVIRLKRKN